MSTLNEYLSIEDFTSIIFNNNKVAVSDSVIKRVEESFDFLKEFFSVKEIYHRKAPLSRGAGGVFKA